VRVLARLFRRLFLDGLVALHAAGRLRFFGDRAGLGDGQAFRRQLAPTRKLDWVVYAKPPFGGPEAVLAYLARYTHRVAISNKRLIALDEAGVTFRYKDYRRPASACLGVCRPKPWPGCAAISAPARRMRPCGLIAPTPPPLMPGAGNTSSSSGSATTCSQSNCS
jgi:hypothetical protein